MRKILTYVVTPLLGLSLLGVGVASAQGSEGWGFGRYRQPTADELQQRFTQQAEMLGVSVDQVKEAWSVGRGLPEVAENLGITREQLQEKFIAERQARQAAHLQELVARGVITQDQATARSTFQQSRTTGFGQGQEMRKGAGFGKGMGGRGHGRGDCLKIGSN